LSIFPGMTQATADRTLTTVVNGESRALLPGSTVGDLLRALSLDPRMVVVEHNREILRDRAALDRVPLTDGDRIEIVHFVGGG
jgi:thiamine biosynthesis protein ThiS